MILFCTDVGVEAVEPAQPARKPAQTAKDTIYMYFFILAILYQITRILASRSLVLTGGWALCIGPAYLPGGKPVSGAHIEAGELFVFGVVFQVLFGNVLRLLQVK